MNRLVTTLPEWQKELLRKVRDLVFSVLYTGSNRYCPVCRKYSSKFRSYGDSSREGSVCVHCNSLERHRLVWLFFATKTDLFEQKPIKFLHVAPERSFVPRLKKLLSRGKYITADLYDSRATVKMDITNIDFAGESFDAIYCSHVLEHVQDDRKALGEFYRVLKNNGWAVFMVPITEEKTYEDPRITDPQERKKAFGQEDHVRCYGKDFKDRLSEAGFKVTVATAEDLCSEEEIVQMGLLKHEEIYYCTKK